MSDRTIEQRFQDVLSIGDEAKDVPADKKRIPNWRTIHTLASYIARVEKELNDRISTEVHNFHTIVQGIKRQSAATPANSDMVAKVFLMYLNTNLKEWKNSMEQSELLDRYVDQFETIIKTSLRQAGISL